MAFNLTSNCPVPEDERFEADGRLWRFRRVLLNSAELGVVVSLDRMAVRKHGDRDGARDFAVAALADFALRAEEVGYHATCLPAPKAFADDGDWRCAGLVRLARPQTLESAAIGFGRRRLQETMG